MKSLQLQTLRVKAFVYKARFLSPEVETEGHDSRYKELVQPYSGQNDPQTKATCGFSVRAHHLKGPPRQEKKLAR